MVMIVFVCLYVLGNTDIGRSIRYMVAVEGVTSLWKGLIPTLWRDVPFSAVYWSLYEVSRTSVQDTLGRTSSAFVCGAFSGMVRI